MENDKDEGICTTIKEGKEWESCGRAKGMVERRPNEKMSGEQWTVELEIRVIVSSFCTLSRFSSEMV